MRSDPANGFSYDQYRSLLAKVKARHEIFSFRQACDLGSEFASRRFLILRHDVEISLPAAVAMAEVDAEAGVRSTFFLLLTGDYNCFEAEGAEHIRRILSLGHEIGLHYDGGLLNRLDIDPIRAIRCQISLLEAFFSTKIEAMSAHQPARSGTVLELPGVINVYDPFFFSEMKYVSDSLQSWREDVDGVLDRHDQIHLLIHECNWSEEGHSWERILHEEAAAKFQILKQRADRSVEMFREGLRTRAERDRLFRQRLTETASSGRIAEGGLGPRTPVVAADSDSATERPKRLGYIPNGSRAEVPYV